VSNRKLATNLVGRVVRLTEAMEDNAKRLGSTGLPHFHEIMEDSPLEVVAAWVEDGSVCATVKGKSGRLFDTTGAKCFRVVEEPES
jgi:hypothetical protein